MRLGIPEEHETQERIYEDLVLCTLLGTSLAFKQLAAYINPRYRSPAGDVFRLRRPMPAYNALHLRPLIQVQHGLYTA